MKKLLLVGALALCGAMNAQKFGATAGLALLNGKAEAPGFSTSDSQAGGYVGLFGEFGVANNFKFVPGINYLGAKDTNAIQLPLMFKYYIQPQFNVALGPQFLFDLGDVPAELKDYYNRTNVGLALGAGYDFTDAIGIEARYGFQLNDHIKGLAKDGGASAKINILNVGVNYKF